MLMRPKGILGTIALVIDIAFYLWAGARLALDTVGRAIVVDDFSNPTGVTARALAWLFQTPWYVPTLLAGVLTIVLIVVLLRGGPRQNVEPSGNPIPTIATVPISNGIEFFESREKLENHRSLDDLLATATTIYAILMVGRKIREYRLKNIRHIHRVILPDPYLKSAIDYAKTVGNEAHFPTYIIESTKFFQDNGIEVKWYPHVVFNSILMGDVNETNGWVHLETNLPYANSNLRHSLTIYHKSYGRLVSSFEDIFNSMWRVARIPGPLSLVSIDKIIMHVASKISESKTDKYYPDARLEIRQKAIDGILSLYGNRSEPTPIKVDGTSWNLARVPIPATYWEKADITVMATESVSENRFVPHTMPTKTSSDIYVTDFEEKYANLQGHWAEVIEIWP